MPPKPPTVSYSGASLAPWVANGPSFTSAIPPQMIGQRRQPARLRKRVSRMYCPEIFSASCGSRATRQFLIGRLPIRSNSGTRFSPAWPITAVTTASPCSALSASSVSKASRPHSGPPSTSAITSGPSMTSTTGFSARPVMTKPSRPVRLSDQPNEPPQLASP